MVKRTKNKAWLRAPGPLPQGCAAAGPGKAAWWAVTGEQCLPDSLPFTLQSSVFAVTRVERSAWFEGNRPCRGYEANCGTCSLFMLKGAPLTYRVGRAQRRGGCAAAAGTWAGSSLVCRHCSHLTVQDFINPITLTVLVAKSVLQSLNRTKAMTSFKRVFIFKGYSLNVWKVILKKNLLYR